MIPKKYLRNGDITQKELNEDQDNQNIEIQALKGIVDSLGSLPELDDLYRIGGKMDPYVPTDPEHLITVEMLESGGVPGPPGTEGVQGPEGPEGPEGDRGPKGEEGPQGPDAVGIEGPAGPRGPAGPDGTGFIIKGEKTIQEILNTPGTQGDLWIATDDDPNASVPGVKRDGYLFGDQWDNIGLIKGHIGVVGPQGEEGPEGPKGEEGPIGPEGPKGDQGDQGTKGEEGPTGPDGPEGDPGPQGEPGADGDPVILPGMIILWHSNVIPAGWVICDGNNGTPNLIERIPIVSNTPSNFYETTGTSAATIVEHGHDASSSTTNTASFAGDDLSGHTHEMMYIWTQYVNPVAPVLITFSELFAGASRSINTVEMYSSVSDSGTPEGTISCSSSTTTTINQAGTTTTNFPASVRLLYIQKT